MMSSPPLLVIAATKEMLTGCGKTPELFAMPLLLKGSCRCNAIRFEVESHTPAPFMLCYCSICRKQQGGGGFAINLGADSETLNIRGKGSLGVYRAKIEDEQHPQCEVSTGE